MTSRYFAALTIAFMLLFGTVALAKDPNKIPDGQFIPFPSSLICTSIKTFQDTVTKDKELVVLMWKKLKTSKDVKSDIFLAVLIGTKTNDLYVVSFNPATDLVCLNRGESAMNYVGADMPKIINELTKKPSSKL